MNISNRCARFVTIFGSFVILGFALSRQSAASEADAAILERHGLKTDGFGLETCVFFEDVNLTTEDFSAVMAAIVRMKTVRDIQFNGVPPQPLFIQELPKLKQLTNLRFSRIDLDATVFRAAARLKKLEVIFVESCRIEGDLIAEISQCAKVQKIFLTECDLQGDVFSPLGHLKKLQILSIRLSPKVGDEGLPALRHYPAIQELYLDGTSVTDEIYTVTENIRELKALNVSNTKVTEMPTRVFGANHPGLRFFHPKFDSP